MKDKNPLTRQQIAERVAGDPVLADFIVPWRLSAGKASLVEGFKGMVDGLSKVKRSAKLQLTVGHENETRQWHIALSRTGSKLSEGRIERPDLEIEAANDVWLKILGGEVSPLEAFGQGGLKVRGDLELCRVIARALKRA